MLTCQQLWYYYTDKCLHSANRVEVFTNVPKMADNLTSKYDLALNLCERGDLSPILFICPSTLQGPVGKYTNTDT